MFKKIKDYFKREIPRPVVETKQLQSPERPIADADFSFTWDDLFNKHIQRNVTQDIVKSAEDKSDMKFTMDTKYALDSNNPVNSGPLLQAVVPESLMFWYSAQGFIGYQLAAIMQQHWLIAKCCNLPAKDAIRKGYEITVNSGMEVAEDVFDEIRQADIRYRIPAALEEFITQGRVFGIRIALFKVESPDPDYYLKPFNPDGVTPGSYKGIVQIDPYWVTPELDMQAGADPASMFFYEPTWWRVNAQRIHRTHLIIFRNAPVADILKPTYLYGGVSVPQQIYEKVYNAERTANEAPQLALTKRSLVIKTDLAKAVANQAQFERQLRIYTSLMNNYGVKCIDLGDEFAQFDTSLADLDAVIMNQYQLVAAAAKIPATKLLGTTPKGFNATGEFDESSYHEELESLQKSDLTPLLERHHLLLIRSEIAPKFGIEPFATCIQWNPTDSPTALELATLNKVKADTDVVLISAGVIDGYDARKRLVADPQSGYNGLDMLDTDEVMALQGGDPGSDPLADPTAAPLLEQFTQYDPEDIDPREIV